MKARIGWGRTCLAAGLCLVSMAACAEVDPMPRDVIVLARGMSFALEEDPDAPNPVISLRAGERVRLVLKNEAPGLLHDLQIPAWGIQTEQIRAGQSAEVIFTVPAPAGRYEYLCRPHGELMKGIVEVVP